MSLPGAQIPLLSSQAYTVLFYNAFFAMMVVPMGMFPQVQHYAVADPSYASKRWYVFAYSLAVGLCLSFSFKIRDRKSVV